MEKLIILDFATGEVDIYPVEYDSEPDMNELLDSLGHRANDCQWMFTQGNITYHNDILREGINNPLKCSAFDFNLPKNIRMRFINACIGVNAETIHQFLLAFPTPKEFIKKWNIGKVTAFEVSKALKEQFGIDWK